MAWIESHQTLKEHPKVYRLMEMLSINKAQVLGHLHLFWWWCVDYAPTGVLNGFNDIQVARAAEWSGEPKMFCNALVTVGFLDRDCGVLTVHDWADFTLHFDLMQEKRAKNREQIRLRVAEYRRKKRECNANVTQCNAPTKLNQTEPNQTNTKAEASPALKAAFDAVYKQGLNIYALVNKYRKESKLNQEIPEEVLLGVCNRFIADAPQVEKHWPWFVRVLKTETEQHFARRQIADSMEFKKPPAFSIKKIMEGITQNAQT